MAKKSKGRNSRIVTIDTKGRVMIPVQLRRGFRYGELLYLTAGSGPCILLLDKQQWNNLINSYHELDPLIESDERNKLRMLQGYMEEIEIDPQGRILLPGHLTGYAKISAKALFLRLSGWIEIWNPDLFEKRVSQINNG